MTRQETVTNLYWDETYTPATETFAAEITDTETDLIKGSGWGYNVGVDGSYYFARNVGIGGVVRYTGATVDLENPLQSIVEGREVSDEIETGGWRMTGGVRFRF